MNSAGARIAREEALEVARHAVVVADEEPREVVDDVVQAGDDQHAVQHAVHEQPDFARAEHRAAHAIHAAFEHRPTPAERGRDDEARDAARDRHEAAAAEEREIARQLDVAEAVVKRAGDQSRDDADRHAELRELARLVCGGGQIARLSGKARQRLPAARRSRPRRLSSRRDSRRRSQGPPRHGSRARAPPRYRSRTAGRGWKRSHRRPRR